METNYSIYFLTQLKRWNFLDLIIKYLNTKCAVFAFTLQISKKVGEKVNLC